jgi:UDP-3-O-[3-hydroxymyristoyl] glucosamine N-acyltransferase
MRAADPPLRFRLGDLAAELDGVLEGDPDIEITGVSGIREAEPGDLTFLADMRQAPLLERTRASAVLVAGARPAPDFRPTIAVSDPYASLLEVAVRFCAPAPAAEPGIHPTAVIGPGVRLAPEVVVGAHAVIEAAAEIGAGSVIRPLTFIGHHAEIGAGCHLGPSVVIQAECVLGDRVVVHPGTVIGSDGFGFRFAGGAHQKIPQLGRVVIEDDVEIGAGCTIDRGTFSETRIGRGTKFDNQVHVGHNVRIGAHSILVAQVGVGGSTTIGHHVVIAGQAGLADHIEIGDEVQIGGKSGVISSVPAKSRIWGYPSLPVEEAKRVFVALRRAPDAQRRIAELERRIEELAAQVAALAAGSGAEPKRRS